MYAGMRGRTGIFESPFTALPQAYALVLLGGQQDRSCTDGPGRGYAYRTQHAAPGNIGEARSETDRGETALALYGKRLYRAECGVLSLNVQAQARV